VADKLADLFAHGDFKFHLSLIYYKSSRFVQSRLSDLFLKPDSLHVLMIVMKSIEHVHDTISKKIFKEFLQ